MKTMCLFLLVVLLMGCAGINAGQPTPEVVILEHYFAQVAASRNSASRGLYFIEGSSALDLQLRNRTKFSWLAKADDFELTNAGAYVLKNDHQVMGSSVKIVPIKSDGQNREFVVLEYSGPLGAVQTFYKIAHQDGKWKIIEVTLGGVS